MNSENLGFWISWAPFLGFVLVLLALPSVFAAGWCAAKASWS